ncbi:MaoC family dehydratase [Methylibium sp.]|uniref:MaoC family dehydratase n=1 Tax=Methylibium sp. TaxID=2067992 RepID=UPI0017923DE8|nr:MaoC family dehydratase [Methylibium sp.]MBA3588051.1 MaoC family dehydratase [Methylibium sp.]
MSDVSKPQRPQPTVPAEPGHTIERIDRYSREDIVAFAAACRDTNPLHTDDALAQRSRFGEVIASGQHTSSMLLGLLVTHFAQDTEPHPAEVLVLHVNFAFRGAIFANEEVRLRWRVVEVAWNGKLGGHVLVLEGGAATARARPALVARATLLVKSAS